MLPRRSPLWHGHRWCESAWTRTRAALSLGMVVGLGAVGTTAQWSQTVTAETGLFTSGSIDLTINEESPTFAFTPMTNLQPTGPASGSGMLTLRNAGSTHLEYLMDMRVKAITTAVTTTGLERGDAAALGDNLTLDVVAGGTSTGTDCIGGTAIATVQRLTADGATRELLSTYRNVDSGSSDDLCVKVSLDPAAPRATRLAQIDVAFIVNAEAR
ncbi:MAG: SipW-dependent-type signal peptide-containing protein [Dietzia sp.]